MTTIENVKGTCLYEGLNNTNSSDVNTIKTLYISNRYWANAGKKFNAPDEEKLNEYTRKNGYGMALGDLEWPNIADVEISNMRYGIHFKEGCVIPSYGGKSFLNAKDSTATFVNVGHDGSSKTEPALILSGGSINFLNSMRSTEDGQLCQNFYTIENETKFRSYNSQAVGMLFRQNVILENIKTDDLFGGEMIYKFWQPISKLVRLLGIWYTSEKQG